MAPKDLSDPALVEACLSGQPGAMDELFKRCASAINSGVRKALYWESEFAGDRDDFYQEFYYEVTRNPRKFLSGFKPEGNLRSWLFTLAFRRTLKRLRSKQLDWHAQMVHLLPLELQELAEVFDEPTPDVERTLRALESLDAESRTVIRMRVGLEPFDREHSLAEIADQFGWSIATACRRLKEVKEKIRIEVERIQAEEA